ncbi:putative sulfate/molybdate transporter [Alienimonas californiensis]|uniref:putative sulfate/molybdate transporter n=1 Tax=Alienimonas californiensis TaxID=2527989 RepID=UPI0013FCF4E4|nr:putative sulfate/molybdate transporter [Alienimonas californiensis]
MTTAHPVAGSADAAGVDASDRLRFGPAEWSGGLGDLGTFLPVTVSLCLVCDLNLAAVMIWAGVLNAVTGLLFRQPIPVQPMKAIAALAIAGGLSAGAVRTAGMGTGLVVLLLGVLGIADRLGRWVPAAVVRGLQLGVGAALAIRGGVWLLEDASAFWLAAPVAAAALLAPRWPRVPLLVVVVAAGLTAGALTETAAVPAPPFMTLPTAGEWRTGLLELAPAQLPLTLLNSVVAVCVLSADYFPGRGVSPGKMATSVGAMNLLSVPFGGMPVCHGAGGLAAQYHFGARTGGAVVVLGGLKIAAGLALLLVPAGAITAFPRPILAVLLIAAGWRLASAAGAIRGRAGTGVTVVTGAGVAFAGTLWGVGGGLALWAVLWTAERVRHRSPKESG